jgi:hypothetical protein
MDVHWITTSDCKKHFVFIQHSLLIASDADVERFPVSSFADRRCASHFALICRRSLFSLRRKREAREVHKRSKYARKVSGLKAKLFHKQRHSEKVAMKKQ